MTVQQAARTVLGDRRALGWGTAAAVGVFSLFGVVTGLIPNPLYVRMVPRTAVDYLFLVSTALLAGAYVALRVATTVTGDGSDETTGGEDNWLAGGLLGGFLAVSCPICNAILLALFSSSALLTYVDPLRPLFGVISVAVLGGLVYVRNQRSCETCNR